MVLFVWEGVDVRVFFLFWIWLFVVGGGGVGFRGMVY